MVTVTQFPNFNKSTIDDLLYSLLLNFGGNMSDVQPIYNDTTKDLLFAILQKTESLGTGSGAVETFDSNFQIIGVPNYLKWTNGQTVPAAGLTPKELLLLGSQIAIPPTYVAPTAALSANQSTSNLEIGQSLNITLDASFTQNDGGAITGLQIRRDGVTISTTEPYTDNDVIITAVAKVYQAIYNYAQGPIKNNNLGQPDATGRINAGSVNSNTISYVGSYRRFFGVGTNPTNSAQVRALGNNTFGNTFSIIIPAGQTIAAFAYPASRPDIVDSSVKYVEGFNSNVGNTFTKSTFDVNDAGGNPVSYKIYVVVLPAPYGATATYNVTIP